MMNIAASHAVYIYSRRNTIYIRGRLKHAADNSEGHEGANPIEGLWFSRHRQSRAAFGASPEQPLEPRGTFASSNYGHVPDNISL